MDIGGGWDGGGDLGCVHVRLSESTGGRVTDYVSPACPWLVNRQVSLAVIS